MTPKNAFIQSDSIPTQTYATFTHTDTLVCNIFDPIRYVGSTLIFLCSIFLVREFGYEGVVEIWRWVGRGRGGRETCA